MNIGQRAIRASTKRAEGFRVSVKRNRVVAVNYVSKISLKEEE